MVRLDLAETAAATLTKALNYYVSELRMEIANTDRKSMRDDLKNEEAVLKKILQFLQAGSAGTA